MAVKVEDLVAELRLDIKNFKGQINNLSKQVDGASKKMSASVGSVSSAFSVLKTAIIGLGLGRLATSIVKTTMDFEKFNASLAAVTGNQQDARKEMQYITSLVRRMGLDFSTAADSYIKLAAAAKGTAINSQQVKDIFEAVSMAAVALGLDAQTAQGSLLAISQMMSKGKVTAEELRGQLGERLPGAMNIMAKALGVTLQELDKMMVSGELLASNVLPKFAAELKNAYGQASQVETAMKAFNRLNTEWTLLKNMIGSSGVVGALSDAVETLTSFLGLLTGNEIAAANENVKTVAQAFVYVIRNIKLTTAQAAAAFHTMVNDAQVASLKMQAAWEDYHLQKKLQQRDEWASKPWKDATLLDPEVKSLVDRLAFIEAQIDELEQQSKPFEDALTSSVSAIDSEYEDWLRTIEEIYIKAQKIKKDMETPAGLGLPPPTNEAMTYKVPFNFASASAADEAVETATKTFQKLISERDKMTDATFQAEMDAAKYTAQASDMIIAEYEGRKNALLAEHRWEVDNKDLLNRQLIALEEQKQGELKRLREAEWQTGIAGAESFFSDMMSVTRGHSKKMFKLMQAGAIATATVKMAEGIARTLGSYTWPLAPVLAAAHGAAFLAQLSAIRNTEYQGYASGGRPRAGVPAIVGERGPEMFIPDQSGTVVPNNKLGAMGTTNVNINFRINAVDSRGVTQVLQEQRGTIIGIIKKHMNDRGRMA